MNNNIWSLCNIIDCHLTSDGTVLLSWVDPVNDTDADFVLALRDIGGNEEVEHLVQGFAPSVAGAATVILILEEICLRNGVVDAELNASLAYINLPSALHVEGGGGAWMKWESHDLSNLLLSHNKGVIVTIGELKILYGNVLVSGNWARRRNRWRRRGRRLLCTSVVVVHHLEVGVFLLLAFS